MELPIQLKFFRKLELYQEFRESERKARFTDREVWDIEKKILKWTVANHHHLESPLSSNGIKKRILERTDAGYLGNLDHAMGNLRVKRFAKPVEGGIEITLEGLMMGEVIADMVEKSFLQWRKYRYAIFLVIVWTTAVAGVFIVIYEAISKFYN